MYMEDLEKEEKLTLMLDLEKIEKIEKSFKPIQINIKENKKQQVNFQEIDLKETSTKETLF